MHCGVRNDEGGHVLVWTLILLGLGLLIIGPLLNLMSTNFLITKARDDDILEQYAADAGVQYGISQVLQEPGSFPVRRVVSLTMPSRVNEGFPRVDVTAGRVVPDQVIWADGGVELKDMATLRVGTPALNADLHSNAELEVRNLDDPANSRVAGTCEGQSVEDPFNVCQAVQTGSTPEPRPIAFDVGAYASRPAGVPVEDYHPVSGNWEPVFAGGDCPDGLYYIAGDVELEIDDCPAATFTIVATGKIEVYDREVEEARQWDAYIDDLLFFSNSSGGIALKVEKTGGEGGSALAARGFFYAPNGGIEVKGAGTGACQPDNRGAPFSLEGALIASSGGGVELKCLESAAMARIAIGGGLSCSSFDIVSTAVYGPTAGSRGTTITSRVSVCDDVPHIESWLID